MKKIRNESQKKYDEKRPIITIRLRSKEQLEEIDRMRGSKSRAEFCLLIIENNLPHVKKKEEQIKSKRFFRFPFYKKSFEVDEKEAEKDGERA